MDTRIPKTYGEAVAPAQTLDRRDFLKQGIKVAGSAVAGGIAGTAALSAQGAEPIGKEFPAWSNVMGKGLKTP